MWQIPLIKMDQEVVGQVKADADAAVRENILVREETADGSLVPYRNRGWWFPGGLMPDLTDERAAEWWTAKRRGDALLVTPVLAPGVADWPVYLPEGEWVDAWTGSRAAGGRTLSVATPRHRVPVFVRADRWPDLHRIFA